MVSKMIHSSEIGDSYAAVDVAEWSDDWRSVDELVDLCWAG